MLSLINLYLYLESLLTVGEILENDAQMRAGAWTDWGPLQDVNSSRVMSTVLDDEAPGYVIIVCR